MSLKAQLETVKTGLDRVLAIVNKKRHKQIVERELLKKEIFKREMGEKSEFKDSDDELAEHLKDYDSYIDFLVDCFIPLMLLTWWEGK